MNTQENQLSPNPVGRDQDKHSKAVDQTWYLRFMFFLALFVIGGLLALEFWHPHQAGEEPMIFTQEVVYVVLNGVVLGFVGLGTYLYGRNSGIAEGMLMAQNGNGSYKYQPGPQTPPPTNPQPTQTSQRQATTKSTTPKLNKGRMKR